MRGLLAELPQFLFLPLQELIVPLHYVLAQEFLTFGRAAPQRRVANIRLKRVALLLIDLLSQRLLLLVLPQRRAVQLVYSLAVRVPLRGVRRLIGRCVHEVVLARRLLWLLLLLLVIREGQLLHLVFFNLQLASLHSNFVFAHTPLLVHAVGPLLGGLALGP